MFAKIAIRNLPDQVFRALENLADRHDRSTEAEARHAIRAWVEPALVAEERNARRQVVAERLNRALVQANANRYSKVQPSHIAEAIGEDRAAEVEDWFLGQKEPSFSQLAAVANFLGVEREWLKHGDNQPYPVFRHRLSENPYEAVEWLTTWNPPSGTPEGKLEALHLVRVDDNSGNLFVVKESDRRHYLIFDTGIHVSEVIGAGGEAMLAALFVTLELLYKRYTKTQLLVRGHQLWRDDVTQLTSGQTNPSTFLTHGGSTWWEDMWDPAMVRKHEYWPGWRSLCDRIEGAIAARQSLSEMRAKIRGGQHLATAETEEA